MFKGVFSTRGLDRWVAQGRRALEDLVFPWECSICGGAASDAPFCPVCRQELVEASGRVCDRCAMPVGPWAARGEEGGGCSECRGHSLGFDAAIALGPYQGPIRDLCLRLKHEKDAWLAPWLADLLIEARAEALRPRVPADAWVVPVPLHWRRQWQRGYNQAESLARRLANRLSLRLVRVLRRVRATPHLATAGRTERTVLMRDAFQVRHCAAPRAARSLAGRTVLLVDDILTTGATCGAAARALKREGAAQVVALVLGRAEGTPWK